MAWLYVPAQGALSSDFDLSLENSTALYVSLSGTPTPRPALWPGWKTRPWVQRLSGTISRPSTAARGVESWILSLRACRASRTPSLASNRATVTTAPSGPSLSASWPSVVPPWCSSKTSQLSFLADTSESRAKNYADWATQSRGRSSWVRATWAGVIDESASSSWPTARETDSRGSAYQYDSKKQPILTLTGRAQQWPTPVASPFNEQSIRFRPPDPTTTPDGPPCCNKTRRLSPRFVHWLMGWPLDWANASCATYWRVRRDYK